MNLAEAITVHMAWRRRLRQFVDQQSNERLSSATVRRDDCCDLGKWILGEGQQYARAPAFDAARRAHTEFHRHAGEVVAAVERGDRPAALALLGDTGAFRRASQEVIAALERLRDTVKIAA
jgi:hypothetical protein